MKFIKKQESLQKRSLNTFENNQLTKRATRRVLGGVYEGGCIPEPIIIKPL